MDVSWSARYPAPETLRNEAACMAEAYAEALLDEVPHEELRGIYLKGSANKAWDSPIDYVPEVSDVDIHVLFEGDETWRRHIGSLTGAMRILELVEGRFHFKVSHPIHTPRPQLLVLNTLMDDADFVASPHGTANVLYGEPYPHGDYSDPDRIRRIDSANLVRNAAFVSEVPLMVVDKPSKYLWQALRQLSWRVSPVGSRVAHISGVDTETAWSLNRTGAVAMLREAGHGGLANSYANFYISAWDYFLSSYQDTAAGRSALSAAVEVLSEAEPVARAWLASHPADP